MEFIRERTKTADKLNDQDVYKLYTDVMFDNMALNCPQKNPGSLGSDPIKIIEKIRSDPSIYDTLPTYFKDHPMVAYEASKLKYKITDSIEYITIPTGTKENIQCMREILLAEKIKLVEELPEEMKVVSTAKKSLMASISKNNENTV